MYIVSSYLMIYIVHIAVFLYMYISTSTSKIYVIHFSLLCMILQRYNHKQWRFNKQWRLDNHSNWKQRIIKLFLGLTYSFSRSFFFSKDLLSLSRYQEWRLKFCIVKFQDHLSLALVEPSLALVEHFSSSKYELFKQVPGMETNIYIYIYINLLRIHNLFRG